MVVLGNGAQGQRTGLACIRLWVQPPGRKANKQKTKVHWQRIKCRRVSAVSYSFLYFQDLVLALKMSGTGGRQRWGPRELLYVCVCGGGSSLEPLESN